jgi:tRNA 2-thiouridine synthesizing protein A
VKTDEINYNCSYYFPFTLHLFGYSARANVPSPKGKDLIDMNFDVELDVCGSICPIPAMKTLKELNKMKPGAVLKVLVDYKPATESVPRYIEKSKHQFLGIEEDEDHDGWGLFFKAVK